MSPQSPGRGQAQEGNITTSTTHRPDGIYVTSNGTMTVTDTDEYEIFLPANRLEQQGSDQSLFGQLRIDLLPLQDGSYSYRSGEVTVESTTQMDDFGTRYFVEENTEPGVAPDERYQWRGLGTGSAEFENHTFGNSYSEMRTLGERRIATPSDPETTGLLFWGFEQETRVETLTSVFDTTTTEGIAYNEGPNGYGGDGGYTISHSESALAAENQTNWTLANESEFDWTYKEEVHDGWTWNLREWGNGTSNSTAQINYAAEGTMGARYDSTGTLIESSGETGPTPVFGEITRTLTGSGNAVAHADSYSLRLMDNYYDSYIIDQHMVIDSNETFEGSKEQATSPTVVTNAENQRYVGYDVDVTGLILVGGTRNTSDHVIVWHNGSQIYDETVGDFDFYADSEPDFGFRDTYDTVGFLAPRVGPTHGPGGDDEQMFTSATTFTGDTPGSTQASWVAFVGEQQAEGEGPQEPVSMGGNPDLIDADELAKYHNALQGRMVAYITTIRGKGLPIPPSTWAPKTLEQWEALASLAEVSIHWNGSQTQPGDTIDGEQFILLWLSLGAPTGWITRPPQITKDQLLSLHDAAVTFVEISSGVYAAVFQLASGQKFALLAEYERELTGGERWLLAGEIAITVAGGKVLSSLPIAHSDEAARVARKGDNALAPIGGAGGVRGIGGLRNADNFVPGRLQPRADTCGLHCAYDALQDLGTTGQFRVGNELRELIRTQGGLEKAQIARLIESIDDDIAAIVKTGVGLDDITNAFGRGGKVIAFVDGNHWVRVMSVFTKDGKRYVRIFDSGRGGYYDQLWDSFFTRMGADNAIINIFK